MSVWVILWDDRGAVKKAHAMAAQSARLGTARFAGHLPGKDYSAALGRSGNRNSRPTLTLGSPS